MEAGWRHACLTGCLICGRAVGKQRGEESLISRHNVKPTLRWGGDRGGSLPRGRQRGTPDGTAEREGSAAGPSAGSVAPSHTTMGARLNTTQATEPRSVETNDLSSARSGLDLRLLLDGRTHSYDERLVPRAATPCHGQAPATPLLPAVVTAWTAQRCPLPSLRRVMARTTIASRTPSSFPDLRASRPHLEPPFDGGTTRIAGLGPSPPAGKPGGRARCAGPRREAGVGREDGTVWADGADRPWRHILDPARPSELVGRKRVIGGEGRRARGEPKDSGLAKAHSRARGGCGAGRGL